MVKDWLFLIVGTEMNYFNFASDQPDSSLHKCLHISKANSFLWSDEDCAQAKSYICQTGKDNAVILLCFRISRPQELFDRVSYNNRHTDD